MGPKGSSEGTRRTATRQPRSLGEEELAKVTVPTLILHGERDHPEVYEAARAKLPNLSFDTVPGVGHGAAATDPAFARRVRQFLQAHPARTSEVGVRASRAATSSSSR